MVPPMHSCSILSNAEIVRLELLYYNYYYPGYDLLYQNQHYNIIV